MTWWLGCGFNSVAEYEKVLCPTLKSRLGLVFIRLERLTVLVHSIITCLKERCDKLFISGGLLFLWWKFHPIGIVFPPKNMALRIFLVIVVGNWERYLGGKFLWWMLLGETYNFFGFTSVFTRPIYVPCVQFCNGGRKRILRSQHFLRPSPIAKLDTRHINRGPRKDVCEAEILLVRHVARLEWIEKFEVTRQ